MRENEAVEKTLVGIKLVNIGYKGSGREYEGRVVVRSGVEEERGR